MAHPFTLSERERWGLKWHLNALPQNDRVSRRRLDRVWDALKLDDPLPPVNAPIDSVDAAETFPVELTSDERDALIDWLDKPMNGALARVLSALDRRLVKSRDGGP